MSLSIEWILTADEVTLDADDICLGVTETTS